MRVIYWLLVITAFACQSNQTETQEKPDAYRDLLIDRVVWKKGDEPNATNRHRFTLTNTSQSYAYEHIEIRFDYFDSTYHKISSSKSIIDTAIGPRAALKIPEIQDGLVNPATKSATVTIVQAKSNRSKPE
ncbi:hypothetical protein [Larkinella terrae]|uniref:DUF1425 domain-containing protein n=1 Tax=Larkinella terrae TaxID=2025311 RepID=A0A7K0EK56_9BACT|nr:hypothetical protein [Larkinella terrae]MRS61911.1 hypothetical protein [Larkinella terrae]